MTEVWQRPTPRVRFRKVSALTRFLLRGSWLYYQSETANWLNQNALLDQYQFCIPLSSGILPYSIFFGHNVDSSKSIKHSDMIISMSSRIL